MAVAGVRGEWEVVAGGKRKRKRKRLEDEDSSDSKRWRPAGVLPMGMHHT
jgi:hypothetical protein